MTVCSHCRSRPPVEGQVRCSHCADRHRQHQARRRAESLKTRLCSQCGYGIAREGKVLCQDCAERRRVTDAERRQRDAEYIERAGGVTCSRCRLRKAEPGMRSCEDCLRDRRESNATCTKLVMQGGKCRSCEGREVEHGSTRCRPCLDAKRVSDAARRTAHGELDRRQQLALVDAIEARNGWQPWCDHGPGTGAVFCYDNHGGLKEG